MEQIKTCSVIVIAFIHHRYFGMLVLVQNDDDDDGDGIGAVAFGFIPRMCVCFFLFYFILFLLFLFSHWLSSLSYCIHIRCSVSLCVSVCVWRWCVFCVICVIMCALTKFRIALLLSQWNEHISIRWRYAYLLKRMEHTAHILKASERGERDRENEDTCTVSWIRVSPFKLWTIHWYQFAY